ncbi:MAG: DUF3037 domain-containing protein [Ignavibacteriae bacterium]|nr:DUF3037 domain-containing protein [Ignavibacteriota bacterium]MCB9215747.1 DUF3037 domain-containing protein [Ignavibacteria bacterium]
MHEICTFDYATIRVVPRVEREEFINVGVILSCPAQKFLEARVEPNWDRLHAFAPELEREKIQIYLNIIPRICAGDEGTGMIGKLTQRERFYWLTAQRSTIIQNSPVHTGFTTDVEKTLEHLLEQLVR